jgi:hypothetical protein
MRQAITTRPPTWPAPSPGTETNELACHAGFTIATGIPACFCQRTSPGSAGSNENTNGLLHQKVLVAAHPGGVARTRAQPQTWLGMLRALPDPDLVEQRAGVIRGLLAVPDPGGDEPNP